MTIPRNFSQLADNVNSSGVLQTSGGGTGSTSTQYASLTANVTGVLPVANGGTGLTAPGTSGNVLTSNGSAWVSSTPASGSKAANVQTFTSSGTWTKPSGYGASARVYIQVWGAGGSGARAVSSTSAGGGGGGGYNERWIALSSLGATETVTIGAGGTARSTDGDGNVGGNSSLGSIITAYGGGGGSATRSIFSGGGGGGQLSAGSTSSGGSSLVGGTPVIQTVGIAYSNGLITTISGSIVVMQGSPTYGNGDGCGPESLTFPAFMHGGGGGTENVNSGNGVYKGNNSVWGGGGGGASNTAFGTGGTSSFGGAGGAGSSTAAGTAGTQPAGGGGGTKFAANSGAGGAGQIIVTVFDGA